MIPRVGFGDAGGVFILFEAFGDAGGVFNELRELDLGRVFMESYVLDRLIICTNEGKVWVDLDTETFARQVLQ